MSWHEDREISPGIPDLHYVMKHEDPHRVGWLELKAVDTAITKSNRIKVEPSQHQYIRKWRAYMPVHFLIQVVDEVFLVDGTNHIAVPEAANRNMLASISLTWFPKCETAAALPGILRTITRI